MTDTSNYAHAHPSFRISSKRFATSPWLPAYANENMMMGVYSRRFYPLSIGDDAIANYWHLRRSAVLFDVPEHPIVIEGSEALALLQKLFCRDISKLKQGRATYAIACNHDGGIIMDGVLMCIGENRYWYVLADGEFMPWIQAHATGMDVTIRDPESWVLQIQGPKAFDVLASLVDDTTPDPFKYFSVHDCSIAGQPFLISRTGWTGEMGFELYPLNPQMDGPAMFETILERGRPHGLIFSSLESMGIRRIEAGIMDNGTDMDATMTPYQAGLGQFVNLDKDVDFIGKEALARAEQGRLFFGLTCQDATPLAGTRIKVGGKEVGHTTAGGWSPYLEKGIAFARMDYTDDWVGKPVTVELADGSEHDAVIVSLPFYDEEKLIPRGLANSMP